MIKLLKHARIQQLRATTLFGFLILTGCPQSVKPPVTEIQSVIPPSLDTKQLKSVEEERQNATINSTEENNLVKEDKLIEENNLVKEDKLIEENNLVKEDKLIEEDESFDTSQSKWNENERVLTETNIGGETFTEQNIHNNNIIALGEAFTVQPIDETTNRVSPLDVIARQVELGRTKQALQSILRLEPTISAGEKATLLTLKAKVFRALNMDIAALRVNADIVELLDDSLKDAAIEEILIQIEILPIQIQNDLSRGTDALAGFAAAVHAINNPSNDLFSRLIRKFRGHPIFSSSLAILEPITAKKKEIAFQITALLPLSGDLANAGRAIRDGLLFGASQVREDRPLKLRILDSETLSIQELRKIVSGIETEFIIGPLKKRNVKRLLSVNPRIPALVLNRLTKDSESLSPQFYSLSLAIEDDARSAVAQAKRFAEQLRILNIHAKQDLGYRVALELDSIVEEFGGTVAGHFGINQKKPQETISQALGVTDSNNRRRALAKLVDLKLAHTPRIRKDMTAVVVQTNSKQARQLRPLLDFYYLDSTPVFLIGAYRNDLADVSEDFKNTHILASPWEIGNESSAALKARPLSAGLLGPLSGIGMDALAVAMHLGFGESVEFVGQSGYLRLESSGIIKRQLSLLSIGSNESITVDLWVPSAPSIEEPEVSDVR